MAWGCIPYTCSCVCACVAQERVGLTWAAYARVSVAEDTTAPHRPRYSTSRWRRYSNAGNCTCVRGALFSLFVARQWCGAGEEPPFRPGGLAGRATRQSGRDEGPRYQGTHRCLQVAHTPHTRLVVTFKLTLAGAVPRGKRSKQTLGEARALFGRFDLKKMPVLEGEPPSAPRSDLPGFVQPHAKVQKRQTKSPVLAARPLTEAWLARVRMFTFLRASLWESSIERWPKRQCRMAWRT